MAEPKSPGGERFKQLLLAKGLKYTLERRQIFAEVERMGEHFDADELFESLKKAGLHISRDTVYRNIPLLLECGAIQKSVGRGRREYFERLGAKGHHDHMVCLDCGNVIEFHSEQIEKLQQAICVEHGFELLFHDHRLFGRCQDCARGAGKTVSRR